jgi:hypothetical protein
MSLGSLRDAVSQAKPAALGDRSGGTHGAEGNRTPDLLDAIEALSQLSYDPWGGAL